MSEPVSTDGGIKLKLRSIEYGEKVLDPIKKLCNSEVMNESLQNFLKGLPSMIMQNGLGQTIAFLQSKGNDKGHKEIVSILTKLLLPSNVSNSLINEILNAHVKKYIMMQKEAIEYAGWMKKFAVAFYVGQSTQEGTGVITTSE